MTLRELLHKQIDRLDTRQLSVLESMIGQLERKDLQYSQSGEEAPYQKARRITVGRAGTEFSRGIIEGREDRE